MTLLIDTSAFSAYGRGSDPRLVQWFKPEHQLMMPLLVIGELRAGFAAGNKKSENEKLLQLFLDAPSVNTLTISDATTKIYADLFSKLRQAGTPIGTNDMWIASLALEHQLQLLTLDADFDNVPDLLLAHL